MHVHKYKCLDDCVVFPLTIVPFPRGDKTEKKSANVLYRLVARTYRHQRRDIGAILADNIFWG